MPDQGDPGMSEVAPDMQKGHKGTPQKGLSLSPMVTSFLETHPDEAFTIRDLVDHTGGKPESVKRILARLSSKGKGSGPVKRVKPGLYQYEKRENLIEELARESWGIENVLLVSLEVYPLPVSPFSDPESVPFVSPSDPRLSVSLPGYPITFPTGQVIRWGRYQNGREEIRFTASGAPPYSPEQLLTVLQFLRERGFKDSEWKCASFELNKDTRKKRIDGSYTLEVFEGLVIKLYQHGQSTRLEYAKRQDCATKEVTDLFEKCAAGLDMSEALRLMREMGKEFSEYKGETKLALSIARNVRKKLEEHTKEPRKG